MSENHTNVHYEKCALCFGTGLGSGREKCLACSGKGSVKVAQPAQRCIRCFGTGHGSGLDVTIVCPDCRGTGWINAIRE